jgi:hypothetical protein
LIDTGCNLPLIINQQTAEALKIRIEKKTVKLKIADEQGLEAKKVKLKVILETLDNDFAFGCTALIIPREEVCIIGTPLLEAICKKTKTDFVLNFMQSKLEFKLAK